MKKKILTTIYLLVTLVITCPAQQTNAAGDSSKISRLKEQANKMADAFKKDDFVTFTNYIHPIAIKMVGGKDKMASSLQKEIGKMKQDGVVFNSVQISNPGKIYKAGKELHCLMEQKLLMTMPNGTVSATTWLLCVSTDNGQTWHFLDTSPLDEELIKNLFPNFNKELVIPEKTDPVFTPKSNG